MTPKKSRPAGMKPQSSVRPKVPMQSPPASIDPDETRDIHELIREAVPEPGRWLHTPNDQLGGEEPANLIGTDKEGIVRDLARAIKHGMFT